MHTPFPYSVVLVATLTASLVSSAAVSQSQLRNTFPYESRSHSLVGAKRLAPIGAYFMAGRLPANPAFEATLVPLPDVAVIDTAIAWSATDTTRHLYTFNGNGRMTLDLSQRFTGSGWVDYARLVYTYDTRGNLLSQLREVQVDGHWQGDIRYSFTYDLANNQLTFLEELNFNGQLTNRSLSTYTYDEHGNTTSSSYQIWSIDSTQWVNSSRTSYVYNAAGRQTSSLYEQWDSDRWVVDVRSTYSYDQYGRDSCELVEKWNGTGWVNFEKISRTFDSPGNLTLWLSVVWSDSGWVNNMRGTNTFDASGSPLSYLYELWRNGRWGSIEQQVFSYDADYRRTSILIELDFKLTGLWPNKGCQSYTYDDQARLTLAVNHFWKDSSWVRGYGWGSGVVGGMEIGVGDSAGNAYRFDEAHTVMFHYRTTSTGLLSGWTEMPASFALFQNYPNPFNPTTTIRYALPKRSQVTLTVFNTLGQQMAMLVNGEVEAGYHEARFDARGLASGVYFYRLTAGGYSQIRKLCIVK
jgi:hypothetical protein